MPTLYVENVPEDLYEALRTRAKQKGRSISAEVMELLTDNVPTEAELARRRAILARIRKSRSRRGPVSARRYTTLSFTATTRGQGRSMCSFAKRARRAA